MGRLRVLLSCSVIAFSLVLTACGGGGGGSTVSGEDTTETTISTEVAEGLGGDGSEIVSRGTTSNSLDIASRISVVDSKEDAATSDTSNIARSILRAITAGDIAGWSANADYNKDVTQVWVNDRSSESFGIINEILCSFEQTRFDEMVNVGPYIAQIDVQLCEQTGADSQEASAAGDGNSSVTVPDYEYWVIDSLRETDDGVQVVYAWIANEEEYGEDVTTESVIMARVVIYKDKDEYPPYGLFTMNFKQVPYIGSTNQINPTGDSSFYGILKSFINTNDENIVSFSLEGEMDIPAEVLPASLAGAVAEMSEYVIMATNSTATGGHGATYTREYMPDWNGKKVAMVEEEETYNIAYNDSYFLREDVDTGKKSCYERDNPKRNVYRYGLYNKNGARVKMRSGVSIGFQDGKELVTGWAGFWGIWIDGSGDENLADLNGQVVNGFNWSDHALDTSESYTIKAFEGKLRKVKKFSTTLDKIKGTEFSYWDNNDNSEYLVYWDGTGFMIKAKRNESNYTWDEDHSSAGDHMDLSQLEWSDLYLWSEAMNGSVRIDLNGTASNPSSTAKCDEPDYMTSFTYDCSSAAKATTPVLVYKEEVIMPESSVASYLDGVSLICYNNCPDPNAADPYYPYFDTWQWDDNLQRYVETAVTYTFDADDMMLKYNGTPVTAPVTNSEWSTSIWTGGMVSQTYLNNNADLLDCPWDNTETCGWMLESAADVFYKWESGSDSWNMLVGLYNNKTNAYESFDQPLSVDYEHTYSDNSVKSFVLQYEGFGNLHGIPELCEDGDTGEAIDCPWLTGDGFEEDQWIRVISEFAIPAGAPATYYNTKTGQNVDVVVKPLEEEHFMRANDTITACRNNGLSIVDYSTQFISVDGWIDPADYGMGAIPYDDLISDEPAVIAGEVQ